MGRIQTLITNEELAAKSRAEAQRYYAKENTDFIGNGMAFPFSITQSGGVQSSNGIDRIKQSIAQILGTRIGERIMRPEFGSNMYKLLFEQNDNVLISLAQFYVVDALKKWEKRITIYSVNIARDSENEHKFNIRIAFQVANSSQEGNLTWPFYRETA